MDREAIEKRVKDLEQEIKGHLPDLNACQQKANSLSSIIITKQGGVAELKKLLEEKKPD